MHFTTKGACDLSRDLVALLLLRAPELALRPVDVARGTAALTCALLGIVKSELVRPSRIKASDWDAIIAQLKW